MEETEIEAKFKVGDRVCSKATGHPAVGIITHAIPALEFYRTADFMTRMSQLCTYDTLYHGFVRKHMYIVSFDKPQKPCRKDEIKDSLPFKFHKHCSEEQLDIIVDKLYDDLKEVYFASYPEDDLELL